VSGVLVFTTEAQQCVRERETLSATLQISGFTPQDTALSFCRASGPSTLASDAPARLEYCFADFNCGGGVDFDHVAISFATWQNGGC
jgi:hypothetical protein